MRIAIAAAVLSAVCASATHAQDRPAAYVNAEACLEAKVDQAVAASSGAADAADFLLTYLCAGPVAAATKYEVNSDLLASGKGMAEGFLTMMPATTMQTGDMPDFGSMSDEEFDAWLKAEEAAAAAATVAAAAGGEAAPTVTFSLDETGGLVPAAPPADPFAGITIDPVTGDILTGDNPLGPMIVTLMDYMEATGRLMSNTPPVFLRERAADLIVQRRRR